METIKGAKNNIEVITEENDDTHMTRILPR